MIQREFYLTREDGVKLYKTYSTENLYIEQIGTNNIYDIAIDVESSNFQYKETDKEIKEIVKNDRY